MNELKTLSAALFAATLALASTAGAHEHGHDTEHNPHHDSPAEDAGGTPCEKGVGGSVEVPSAGGGAEETTPYDDVGDLEDDEGDDGVRGTVTGEKSLHETQETR
ncbi:hypothetical protein KEM63_07635 [Halopseudomonas nanhaiensis]|uniref:hypothetical protein n=1 Tax=Halopseudomonas nanhaiensis TaxID=2830842 RepID=UPI001CBBFC59|nr:hypothetical protein [Halopseudomonas nanhaiensis]UAW99822.1 hypothetical protein KEM63_07635 [Halopseudomonas nanhaiensis]